MEKVKVSELQSLVTELERLANLLILLRNKNDSSGVLGDIIPATQSAYKRIAKLIEEVSE